MSRTTYRNVLIMNLKHVSFFNSLAKSHRDYFIKWIESAKSNETRAKRIVNTVNAMLRKWDYGTMIREMRKVN